jgi:hypothetical protein
VSNGAFRSIGAVCDFVVASTTGRLSAAATNQKCNTADHHHCADEKPERQNEVKDYAKGNECNEPRESVTPGKTALHDFAIDLLSGAS